VSTISGLPVVNTLFLIAEKDSLKDWHVILDHPLDVYVKKFFELMGIKTPGKTGLSAECEVCRLAKLKQSSHSNPLPTAKSPFKMIHMNIFQVTLISRGSFKYILVLIDDFLRYNRIYLLQKKNESESKIILFIKEIQNHLHVTPAILHTDRGGEFGSNFFKAFLSEHGVSLEQGPANSPQTNGLAERFNQAILVKMRCMLAQSSVPLNHWDKASRFASTLINMLL
jgi:transposase InsO family protein